MRMIHSVVIREKPPSKRPRKQSRRFVNGLYRALVVFFCFVFVFLPRFYVKTPKSHQNEYSSSHRSDFFCGRSENERRPFCKSLGWNNLIHRINIFFQIIIKLACTGEVKISTASDTTKNEPAHGIMVLIT